jgi:hypothetical protein
MPLTYGVRCYRVKVYKVKASDKNAMKKNHFAAIVTNAGGCCC